MKKNSFLQTDRLHRRFYFYSSLAIFMVLCTYGASAQSTDETAKLSETIILTDQWKDRTGYENVITEYLQIAEEAISTLNLQGSDLALYKGFKRVLTYMHEDIEANIAIPEIADKNYKRVMSESHSDPELLNLQADAFKALFDNFSGKLHL